MKVTVKTKKLEELFNHYHEAVLKGNLEKDEAARRLNRSESEDGIFSEHQKRVREDSAGSRRAGSHGAPPIRFADPADAKGRRNVTPRSRKDAAGALMAAVPGEESHLIPNMQDAEGQALHRRAQDMNDALIMMKVLKPSFDWRDSDLYPQYQDAMFAATNKILTTQTAGSGSGSGGDFIPNTLSSQLVPPFRDSLTVAPALQHITMTESPMRLPLMGASMVAYTMGEETADTQGGTPISRSTPATSQVTFTARDLKVATYVSEEVTEDSIIATLPMIRTEIGTALGEGWDNALVNGDRSSNHQDADVTTATDRRKAINGLRVLAAADSKVSVGASSGRLRARDFITARIEMGRYAQNPADLAIFLSYTGIQHLVGDTDLQKLNEFGPQATLLRGTIGSILGAPVIPTGFIRDDLDSTGVNTGAGSVDIYTIGIQVNRRAFWIGDRRNITIKSDEEIINDRILVVGTFRGDMQRVASPTSANQRALTIVRGIDTTFSNF